jgi:hypothetical protein
MTASFLLDLKMAAEAAKNAEGSFRREAALRIAALEEERAFAFRRYNLLQAVAQSMASAESEEIAVANAFATLRTRLGWTTDNEPQAEVMEKFSPVARAVFQALAAHEDEFVGLAHKALADFESWYAASRGSSFWQLFEQQIPDTPRVDF